MISSVRFSSKGKISPTSFRLSNDDIERQVIEDLSKYRRLYSERYQKEAPTPLDVENYVKELWDVEVIYDVITQTVDSEVLGYLDLSKKHIVVDARACNHARRISFTVAHEAGHLALHSFMYLNVSKASSKKPAPHIEYQADTYASLLLAPTHIVLQILEEQGLVKDNRVLGAVDVEQILSVFQDRVGLSRHALEIRLRKMGITLTNARYPRGPS